MSIFFSRSPKDVLKRFKEDSGNEKRPEVIQKALSRAKELSRQAEQMNVRNFEDCVRLPAESQIYSCRVIPGDYCPGKSLIVCKQSK